MATYRWGIDPCPTPYDTVFESNIDRLVKTITTIIENECIDIIILGLPTHADGSDSDSTKRVRFFENKLATQISLPIAHQDEKLSSFEAKERLKESMLEGGQFKEGYIDQLSATIILEDFIQKTKSLG